SALPNLDLLTTEERAALANEWARDAAAEHASIAAFSRFSLQLLALGAPADLVEAAHEAALDEARHAREAYALASAFAGQPIGPAPLDVNGALAHVADVTLEGLAIETFEEGCVGETLAAMDAHEKHAKYTDFAVHDVLARIAADEERHAELAWRTVAWAVRAGGDDVKRAIAESLARLSGAPEMSQNTVFSAVIVPCANALLEA
ncbi:MAG: ferritin-like domain-containing protein, partial [Polyangiaceae bacterium]